jgi:hypothetical protein
MNETKKKRVKNGMRRMVKRERKMKSNGRRMYQPMRKPIKKPGNSSYTAKIFVS